MKHVVVRNFRKIVEIENFDFDKLNSNYNINLQKTSTNSKMILRSRFNRNFVSNSIANFFAFQTIFVYFKLFVFLYVLLCSFQVFCQNFFKNIVNFDNDIRNVKNDRSCSCASKTLINSMRVWFYHHLIHTIFSHQFVFRRKFTNLIDEHAIDFDFVFFQKLFIISSFFL